MALQEMRSDLAVGIGSKQTPQNYEDGHSATQVSGKKSFDPSDRFNAEDFQFRAFNRVGDELTFKFNENFDTPSIVTQTKDILDDYYQRAFNEADPLSARKNKFGFDEPFVLREVNQRWGSPGFGVIKAGAQVQANRTIADIERISKFLITPRGAGFVLKQDILQKLNSGGAFEGGTLGSQIIKRLGGITKTGPKTQLDANGVDLKGSDIRTWRPTSVIDSLVLGGHFVRHKVPTSSPVLKAPGLSVDTSLGGFAVPSLSGAGITLLKGVSNFVVDVGGGTFRMIDGIDVAFPNVSLNPEFQAGKILTGVGSALKSGAKGTAALFSNIAADGSEKASALGGAIADKLRDISFPNLPNVDFNLPFTGRFSGLVDIGKIGKPDFSAVKKAMGSLQADIKNILGKIKPPSIGMPSLPGFKFPKLPDIPSPNITIGNPFKGLKLPSLPSIPLPKFGGTGGLGLGSFSLPSLPKLNFPAVSLPKLPNIDGINLNLKGFFPSVSFNPSITGGGFSFDMREFDTVKRTFQGALSTLIKTPGFDFNSLSSHRTAQNSAASSPNDSLTGGSEGAEAEAGFGYGYDVNFFGSIHDYNDDSTGPKLYYTVAQDFKDNTGGMINLYDKNNRYEEAKKEGWAGISIQKTPNGEVPIAFFQGFSNRLFGGNDEITAPLNVKPIGKDAKPINFPKNQVIESQDGERRLQKYMLADYGSLTKENRYDETNPPGESNADFTRGIGSPGASGRIGESADGLVIKTESGFKSTHADKINLHPYGGLKDVPQINDNEDDFVPLKFRDKVNGKYMIFRSILESISDNSAPEYAEERYIGRPDKVYVYQGATRNVNITFRVMPKSVQELIVLWEKLNYLRGLTYPNIQQNRMIAPMMEFTLGDMYDLQPMLLQNLNYTIDTSSTWEIKPGLRLPKFIQVAADMRLLEKHIPKTTGKFYDLDWLSEYDPYPDYDGTSDTFMMDPSRDRSTHAVQPAHFGKYRDLWAELNIVADLDNETREKISADAAEFEALERQRDTAISTLNATRRDIPKSSKELTKLLNL